MTKNKAYEAMIQGKKVAHMYFDEEEYIYIKDGVMRMENGARFQTPGYDGWEDRSSEAFQKDWHVVE